MTACSAHKTLPVLTGGAWLNIGDPRFVSDAKDAMALFGSTSPSYLVMASLDLCTRWIEQESKDAYRDLERTVGQLREAAVQAGMTLPQGPADPTRLFLPHCGRGDVRGAGGGTFPELWSGAGICRRGFRSIDSNPLEYRAGFSAGARCDPNHAQTIAAGIAGNGFAAVAAHVCFFAGGSLCFAGRGSLGESSGKNCGFCGLPVSAWRAGGHAWGKNYPGSRRVFTEVWIFYGKSAKIKRIHQRKKEAGNPWNFQVSWEMNPSKNRCP